MDYRDELVDIFNKVIESKGYKLEIFKKPFKAIVRDRNGNELELKQTGQRDAFTFIGHNDDVIRVNESGILTYDLRKEGFSIQVWHIMEGPTIEIENYGHSRFMDPKSKGDKITLRTVDYESKNNKHFIRLINQRCSENKPAEDAKKEILITQYQTSEWGEAYIEEYYHQNKRAIPVDVNKYYEIILDAIDEFNFFYPEEMKKILEIALPAIRYQIDNLQHAKERALNALIERCKKNRGEFHYRRKQLIEEYESKIKGYDNDIVTLTSTIMKSTAERQKEFEAIRARMAERDDFPLNGLSLDDINSQIEDLKLRIWRTERGNEDKDDEYVPEDLAHLYEELGRFESLGRNLKQHK